MIKIYLVCLICFTLLIKVSAQEKGLIAGNDSIAKTDSVSAGNGVSENDTIAENDSISGDDSIVSNIPFFNSDKDIDSLISTKYSNQVASPDTALPVDIDTVQNIVTDIPDSVYIERIRKIPSVISLTYNSVVKRYIEAYTINKREKLEEILGLKAYYFPIFEQILDAYGLPLELKYLSVIESALNTRAVSRVGATGLWQFMYHTGKLYKLKINSFVDERRDPVAATKAAAQYLKDAYAVYGDWVLAIAAYNCGAGNVNKAIHRSGGKTNYWAIYPYLPRETRGYVPAFIAAVYSMTYYKDYNLTPIPAQIPPASDTIMVHENIHLQQIADVLHVPMPELTELNPEYRLNIVPGRYSPCSVRLPVKYVTRFIDLEDSIYHYKHDVFFAGDFKIIKPSHYRWGRYAYVAPSSKNMRRIIYTVHSGDNLGAIAMKYKVRITDLRYWNYIRRNLIRVGQRLVIYVPKAGYKHLHKTVQKELTSNNNADSFKDEISSPDQYIYYQVKMGDSLWKIASQYPGVSEEDIMKWNNLSYRSKILPGQNIKIKKFE